MLMADGWQTQPKFADIVTNITQSHSISICWLEFHLTFLILMRINNYQILVCSVAILQVLDLVECVSIMSSMGDHVTSQSSSQLS